MTVIGTTLAALGVVFCTCVAAVMTLELIARLTPPSQSTET
jgi:hypothetical protein